MIKISPSILACDFANLEKECKKVLDNGADMLHIDVMDGHFVPNITIGDVVLNSIKKKLPKAFYDVHLMIESPLFYAENFIKAGANIITFHIEIDENIEEVIKEIKAYDCKVGIALKPKTGVDNVFPYLGMIDMVLIMTVEPGFGGQGFIRETIPKINALKEEINKNNLNHIDIQVDGGINKITANLCKTAGANILVAGSYIFNGENVKDKIDSLR